jgi:hypothetical protein
MISVLQNDLDLSFMLDAGQLRHVASDRYWVRFLFENFEIDAGTRLKSSHPVNCPRYLFPAQPLT